MPFEATQLQFLPTPCSLSRVPNLVATVQAQRKTKSVVYIRMLVRFLYVITFFVGRMGLCGIRARSVRRTPNNFLIRAIFRSHRMRTAVLTPSGYYCVTLRHAYTDCRHPPFYDVRFSFVYQKSQCDSCFGHTVFKSRSDYWFSLPKLFVVLPSPIRK